MSTVARVRLPLLILAYLGFISLGLPDGLQGVAWPSMRGGFGVPIEAVGLLLVVGFSGYLLSSVVTGFALARLGVGGLLAGSTALVAVALAGFAASPVFAAAVGCALLLGLGSGAIDAGLNVYAAAHFRARHMNWLHASFGFGATLGPLVMTSVLGAGLTWRWGYGLTAVVQGLLAVAFALTVRAWVGGAAPATGGSAAPVGGAVTEAGDHAPAPPHGRRAALAVPAVWLGAATFFLYTGVEVAAGLWAFALLTDGRGLSATVAGICVSAYWGSLFVGRLGYGVVADRLPSRPVLLVCMAGMVAGALVVAVPTGWPAVLGLMLIGGFAAPVFPLLTLTTADRVGAGHAGPAVGVQIGAAALGGVVCPALTGALIGRFGTGAVAPVLVGLALAMLALHLATRRAGTPRVAANRAGT